MVELAYAIIIFAGFGGFLLSSYLFYKKSRKEHIVCPIGSSCEEVIYSEYSRFFGIPNLLVGILYYGAITALYGAFLVMPRVVSPFLIFASLTLTTAAVLFSIYLVFIQAFVLRRWCTWCLMSAGFTVLIFGFAVVSSDLGFIELLASQHNLIAIVHLLGAAVGLGAATVTDVFFFKFLKDFKISEFEANTLRILSQVIWFALGLIFIAGLGLYLPEMEILNETPKFLAKMLIFFVIVINGAFLNLYITPHLVKISFGKKHHHEAGELHRIRRTAFTLGAVSIISWYSAFILGALRGLTLNLGEILLIYLLLLGVGVAFSRIFERSMVLRSGE